MPFYQESPNLSIIHIFISIVFTLVVWLFSITFLLPLLVSLKFSLDFRKLFFSWIFRLMGSLFSPETNPLRKKACELIPTNIENVKMLEIGVGTGANFEYYPQHCKVTLLDMNENFESDMRKRLEKYPLITIEKFINANAENMVELEDEEFDVVLCTHLLCSTQNTEDVLKEACRVLKPGGKFVYLDHVGFPKNYIAYWIQTCMTPLWCIYMNGCCLNRHSHKIISDYFSQNSYKRLYPTSLPLFIQPHVVGIATK